MTDDFQDPEHDLAFKDWLDTKIQARELPVKSLTIGELQDILLCLGLRFEIGPHDTKRTKFLISRINSEGGENE